MICLPFNCKSSAMFLGDLSIATVTYRMNSPSRRMLLWLDYSIGHCDLLMWSCMKVSGERSKNKIVEEEVFCSDLEEMWEILRFPSLSALFDDVASVHWTPLLQKVGCFGKTTSLFCISKVRNICSAWPELTDFGMRRKFLGNNNKI